MIKYVLGFAFDDLGRVALVQKERPAWQSGKLNGVGGHIEGHEEVLDAMVREFYEETGVTVVDWDFVGEMRGADWHVTVLTTVSPEVRNVTTVTDEVVMLYVPGSLS
ncbi:MAG TPA: NUDIX domain-containing protein, partial [Thermoanaerobaculia bacterium]|nr:NUDIX domain-containing protein [Thermoanaerobaculia bacterium]